MAHLGALAAKPLLPAISQPASAHRAADKMEEGKAHSTRWIVIVLGGKVNFGGGLARVFPHSSCHLLASRNRCLAAAGTQALRHRPAEPPCPCLLRSQARPLGAIGAALSLHALKSLGQLGPPDHPVICRDQASLLHRAPREGESRSSPPLSSLRCWSDPAGSSARRSPAQNGGSTAAGEMAASQRCSPGASRWEPPLQRGEHLIDGLRQPRLRQADPHQCGFQKLPCPLQRGLPRSARRLYRVTSPGIPEPMALACSGVTWGE